MTDIKKVIIVDDHPMVAEGIEAILETYDDIEVVGTLSNGQDAVPPRRRCGFESRRPH